MDPDQHFCFEVYNKVRKSLFFLTSDSLLCLALANIADLVSASAPQGERWSGPRSNRRTLAAFATETHTVSWSAWQSLRLKHIFFLSSGFAFQTIFLEASITISLTLNKYLKLKNKSLTHITLLSLIVIKLPEFMWQVPDASLFTTGIGRIFFGV